MSADIGFEVKLNRPYDDALEMTKAALKAEGFGVLTSIDVKATMKEKLDVEFRPYTILGACNPPLAHRALTQDAVAGLLLPCNVTVESEGSSASIVRIANPRTIFSVGSLENNPEITAVAEEAHLQLERVAEALLAS
ncbi:MAG TPA: DUF302 domain-containing protein [Anaerolineales bacterium]|nr:DUF302 domain-containing protein [Anaerolineales bacterium]